MPQARAELQAGMAAINPIARIFRRCSHLFSTYSSSTRVLAGTLGTRDSLGTNWKKSQDCRCAEWRTREQDHEELSKATSSLHWSENIVFIGVLAGIWVEDATSANNANRLPVPRQVLHATSTEQFCRFGTAADRDPLVPVQLSAERLQSIGVKFGLVERKTVQDEIRWQREPSPLTKHGFLTFRRESPGTSRRSSRMPTYQYVRKGQPLFTIHSPELIVAEREYMLAKQNANNSHKARFRASPQASHPCLILQERFEQWDIPEQEIARLESNRSGH